MMRARLLPETPILSLDDYEGRGGGRGLDAARRLGTTGTIEHLLAAGLRGRGGAGFPTGQKWEAVRVHESSSVPATVVVNAAEGEPGSFKDRMILRTNPYAVLEGALIAAHTVGARRVVVALKQSFTEELRAVRQAIDALRAAGWADNLEIDAFAGPREYLYGEETGLLEAIDGRPPFPRVAPPYRHGVEELGDDGSGEAAQIAMAGTHGETPAAPTLVNNVETLANVPGILEHGPAWFRELGTDESPGTIVCTITGATQRDGVAEFPMGTPLREVIETLGGGARPGHRIVGAMSGVANPVVPEAQLDTPLSYEAMTAIGSGLGAAGFIVFDDETDLVAVAAGVSRFLAVESCGQCTPCKEDGLAVAELLDRTAHSDAHELDLLAIDEHLQTITDGARCFLAHQHQHVIGSLLATYPDAFRAHIDAAAPPVDPMPIAAITELRDQRAELDDAQRDKQPDWTFDAADSGNTPVERLGSPAAEALR
jgi:NADH:ubiquinone oxidoreductase subunit F (NADH-binding)